MADTGLSENAQIISYHISYYIILCYISLCVEFMDVDGVFVWFDGVS